jgi:acetyl-CoA carboxylase carboxyltransferase component
MAQSKRFADLDQRRASLAAGGGPEAVKRQHDRGKLTARERLALLLDEDSFVEFGLWVKHRCFELAGREFPADGVVTGKGEVEGQPVFAFAQDFTVGGGAVGGRQGPKMVELMHTAQNELISLVTIVLGLCVGVSMSGETFLRNQTLKILVLGCIAFGLATAGGVLLGKVLARLPGSPVNPLIGAAGVSAVPMAARVVHTVAQETDPDNYLLMQAMGPNVAGVIGTMVAAGGLLALLR